MPQITSTPPAPQTLTMDLRQRPGIEREARDLLLLSDAVVVTSSEQSVSASDYLQKLQKLRKFLVGIYKDAKQPLAHAKKTLDAQEHALVDPIKVVEKQVMGKILAYTQATKYLETRRGSTRPHAALDTAADAGDAPAIHLQRHGGGYGSPRAQRGWTYPPE